MPRHERFILIPYGLPPDPQVVDIYQGAEVIRRQHPDTGQLMVTIGTTHSARKSNPEAKAIKEEFQFIRESLPSMNDSVQVYLESRKPSIRHKGKVIPGLRLPEISTRRPNKAMKLHNDMGLATILAVQNDWELSSVITQEDERDILLQLAETFYKNNIMQYLTLRQIPQWHRIKGKKPELGDYLRKEVLEYYGSLLKNHWQDFDFSTFKPFFISQDVLNYIGQDLEKSGRLNFFLKKSVGNLFTTRAITETAVFSNDPEAISHAFHVIKDQITLEKLTKEWGDPHAAHIVYVGGYPHGRAMAGELANYGVAIHRHL